ncbi:hypothetical protein C2S53_017103 [Perilla frutescens var. hirtella]|uniref:Uncharacterized protein n=1 Tax=Perilla frutescens var. hirtella TaxID=608512 RepID=A0AAD4P1P1_PERFH|nr:hypothetical protein C2S53_017103 [Perilla frutescens var. hirtella]
MNCINSPSLSSPPSSIYVHRHTHKHQIWPANKPLSLQLNGNGNDFSLSTPRALPSLIILATTAPPAGKLSVLLQTGAVCLVAYWVANFVVPGIILKDLQSKHTNQNDENPDED